jgi:catechol 2,3-dioxygenase-like lactoylglutathione lyase family enzyme
MSTSSATNNEPVGGASAAKVDMKFEVIVIPVADVDRSKAFYTKLGWRLDADFSFDNGFRAVQFTPPGSGCSVQFGSKITTAAPGEKPSKISFAASRDRVIVHWPRRSG